MSDRKVLRLLKDGQVTQVDKTSRTTYFQIVNTSGVLYDLSYKHHDKTINCTCKHGSVFRFRKKNPGVCYHARIILELMNDGNTELQTTENRT